jgi:putative component of membrane protein insertase Oxa1/YidC/SpoIIIJ protein YidD
MNFRFEVALIKTIWGEPYEVKVSRAVLKTSSLWRHRGLSLTILRCNPWHPGGLDPVPKSNNIKKHKHG